MLFHNIAQTCVTEKDEWLSTVSTLNWQLLISLKICWFRKFLALKVKSWRPVLSGQVNHTHGVNIVSGGCSAIAYASATTIPREVRSLLQNNRSLIRISLCFLHIMVSYYSPASHNHFPIHNWSSFVFLNPAVVKGIEK